MRNIIILLILLQSLIICSHANSKTIQVGKDREIKTPSQAKQIAADGDLIEIDSGIYEKDAVNWRDIKNLTIRGIGAPRPHIKADGASASGKGIWVFEGGNDITIENIEFSGASVPDGNGAGIRFQSTNLIIRNCYFHNNENGILGGGYYKNLEDSEVLIENSEFTLCGKGDGQTHNIYIDVIGKFTLKFSHTHNAITGHNIKSRAKENHILYNKIGGSNDGRESRSIDLPVGGLSFIIGNIIQQSPFSENRNMIGYSLENFKNPIQELYVINNTIVSNRPNGILIDVSRGSKATVANNIFTGDILDSFYGIGRIDEHNNHLADLAEFTDPANFDYRLSSGSKAIDMGIMLDSAHSVNLMPTHSYRHPQQGEIRQIIDQIDAGAYEFYESTERPSQVQGLQVFQED